MELCTRTETTDEILGRLATEGSDPSEKEGGDDITNALQRLTEPSLPYHIPSLGSVVSRATTRLKIKPEEAPIPPLLLNRVSYEVHFIQLGVDDNVRLYCITITQGGGGGGGWVGGV